MSITVLVLMCDMLLINENVGSLVQFFLPFDGTACWIWFNALVLFIELCMNHLKMFFLFACGVGVIKILGESGSNKNDRYYGSFLLYIQENAYFF